MQKRVLNIIQSPLATPTASYWESCIRDFILNFCRDRRLKPRPIKSASFRLAKSQNSEPFAVILPQHPAHPALTGQSTSVNQTPPTRTTPSYAWEYHNCHQRKPKIAPEFVSLSDFDNLHQLLLALTRTSFTPDSYKVPVLKMEKQTVGRSHMLPRQKRK